MSLPRCASLAAAATLLIVAADAQEAGDRSDVAPPDARAVELFHANCASCHGETGDGKGWTTLDRPARSFKEGGFSFGNTPETIFRTLSTGIPGTPMPAFDRALSEADRRLLAAHVLALGPEVPGPPPDTELAVVDRPLVVYGMLPPIAEGLPERPRALLIGRNDGTTLEYRTDDVRLLGIRQGRFVERTDWIGRGGTPLAPLGRVVYLHEGGDPGPMFELVEGRIVGSAPALVALRAKLLGWSSRDGEVALRYSLHTPDGERIAEVEESVRTLSTSVGSGFVRRFRIKASKWATLVAHSVHPPRGAGAHVDDLVVSRTPRAPVGLLASGQARFAVARTADGFYRVTALPRAPWLAEVRTEAGPLVMLALAPGETVLMEEALLTTLEWNATVRNTLFEEAGL